MTVLTIIARKRPWTTWPIARNIVNILVGLLMAGLCGLVFSGSVGTSYVRNGMAVPTMTILWLFILILTHMSGATPVIGKAMRTMSGFSGASQTNDQTEHSTTKPSAKQNMAGHPVGKVSLGHMTFRGTPNKGSSGHRQTPFYGQARDEEEAYASRNRYSVEQDIHDPVSGRSISTAAESRQISTYDERYPNSHALASTVPPELVDRQDTVSHESYLEHGSVNDHRFRV